MKKALAIAVLAFYWLNAAAQQGNLVCVKVSGKVTDTMGTALVNATVQLSAGSDTLNTITNSSGLFVFSCAPSGKVRLDITMKGYLPSDCYYIISAGKPSVS